MLFALWIWIDYVCIILDLYVDTVLYWLCDWMIYYVPILTLIPILPDLGLIVGAVAGLLVVILIIVIIIICIKHR